MALERAATQQGTVEVDHLFQLCFLLGILGVYTQVRRNYGNRQRNNDAFRRVSKVPRNRYER